MSSTFAAIPSLRPVLTKTAACLLLIAAGSVTPIARGNITPVTVALQNGQSTIAIEKAHGAIVSLVDHKTKRELIAKDPAAVLFRLGFSKPGDSSGEMIWLTSRDAQTIACATEEDANGKTIKLTFKSLGGRRMDAQCTILARPSDGNFLWEFALDGPEALILERVEYPFVVLRAPSRDESGGDAFVAGDVRGGVFPQPGRWPVGREAGSLCQPGSLAAQFGCYYDPLCGFYSATQDSRGCPKRLRFRRTASGLEFAWERHCYHDLSQRFDLGYAVAQATFHSQDPALSTDWRDAADLYKAWALKQPWCARTLVQREDLPAWLKEGAAMVKFRRRHTYYQPNVRLEYHPDWYSQPDQMEGWLKDYWRKQFSDVPLIAAFWGWEKAASWISPHYFPPYPSEEGLRQRVKAVREAGGHPFFWPSGYHWAVTFRQRDDGTFDVDDRAEFDRVAKPHSVVTRNGSVFARKDFWLAGGTNCVLCRGDDWTRQWLNGTATELARRGADLIQVDQVTYGCAPWDRGCCYSSAHGHPPGPGPWFVQAFTEQLRTMLDESRRLNPAMILGFEGAQELFLQQIGILDYRDFEVYWDPGTPWREPASVFGYLYHEFVPFFQSNPEGFRGKPPGGNMLQMAHSLVGGQMPHLVPHWPLRPEPALANGGFEQRTGKLPDGWSCPPESNASPPAGGCACDPAVKHGGSSSLRLESPGDGEVLRVAQSIGVGEHEREVGSHGPRAGESCRLSLWLKADKLGKTSRLDIRGSSAGGAATANCLVPLLPGEDWQRVEVPFTIPDGTVRLDVVVELTGPCKAWMDDVIFETIDSRGASQIVMQEPILPPEHKLAEQWVKLFHGAGRPYLAFGRMLHPPRLETEKTTFAASLPAASRTQPRTEDANHLDREWPAILHNAYRAPDGSEATVAVNITGKPQTGRLHWHGKTVDLSLSPWDVALVRP